MNDFKKPDMNKIHKIPVKNLMVKENSFSDGRPYVAELWAEDSILMMTIYLPADGFMINNGTDWKSKSECLNTDDAKEVTDYLVREGVISEDVNSKYI